MCVSCEKEFWFYLGGRRYHTLAKSINVPSLLNKVLREFSTQTYQNGKSLLNNMNCVIPFDLCQRYHTLVCLRRFCTRIEICLHIFEMSS